MTMKRTLVLIAALYGAVTGCDRRAETPLPNADARPEVVASAGPVPPPAFAACNACHTPEPEQHGIGPSLAGVFGRPAATAGGFNYTPALRQSGLVWDEATLHRFLANPRATVPGTSMAYAGMRDARRRQEIIDWLKTV